MLSQKEFSNLLKLARLLKSKNFKFERLEQLSYCNTPLFKLSANSKENDKVSCSFHICEKLDGTPIEVNTYFDARYFILLTHHIYFSRSDLNELFLRLFQMVHSIHL